MTASPASPRLDLGPAGRIGRALQAAAFAGLLLVMAGRCFLGEMPYRSSALRVASAGAEPGRAGQGEDDLPNRTELGRVVFAVVLLGCLALWLVGAGVSGRLVVRHGWLLALIVALAAWTLVAALGASDRRSALDSWIEQVAILSACFLAVQCCADRRRFGLVVIVLAAVGGALAVKSIWQVLVEVPARVEDFEMYRAERLRQFHWAPGTPQAQLIETRMRDPAPFGYFALANLFASLLLVLLAAAAALATDKLVRAVRSRRETAKTPKPGEIHLPTLAAILTLVMAVAVAVVLVLTRSRGGIVAAAVAALPAAGILRFRRRLARHWRKAVLVAGGGVAVALAGVVTIGLARDRLPTKTMTFRWFYWTASARIVADHPVWGVGPGNFHQAYLQYRRPAAEEAVKMPHNVIAHALTQFGLPGGGLYLAILTCVLVGLCRPRPDEAEMREGGPPPSTRWVWLAAGLFVTVLVVRIILATGSNAYLIFLDAALPAAVLAGGFLLAYWAGGRLSAGPPAAGRFSRVLLACGLGAFVLHNLVTFGFWTPGTALVFWTAAGACLAQAGGGRERNVSMVRWSAAALGVAAVVAAVWWLAAPVAVKTDYFEPTARRRLGAERAAVCAAEADPLDPVAAADAAKAILATCPRGWMKATATCLAEAATWADEAMRRDPANYAWARLAAEIAWSSGGRDAYHFAWHVAGGDPEDRIEALRSYLATNPEALVAKSDLAGAYYEAGRYDESAGVGSELAAAQPDSYVLRIHLGNALWRAGRKDEARIHWAKAAGLASGLRAGPALALMAKAVRLNPQDMRLRVRYAEMLCAAGRADECLEQITRAKTIANALIDKAVSVQRFNPSEQAEIEMLTERAGRIRAGKAQTLPVR